MTTPARPPSRSKPAPRRYRRISDEEKTRVMLLHNEGVKPPAIGRILDRDPAQVRRLLNESGIETPKLRWDAPRAMRMLDDGMTPEEVAKEVGRKAATVKMYAQRHGPKG